MKGFPAFKRWIKNTNKVVFSTALISILIIVLILAWTINQTQLNSDTSALSVNIQSQYGKGLIHYTENYIRNYSYKDANLENIPVPNNVVSVANSKYVEGVECSRYLDLSQSDINSFKELGLKHIIVGFGPASWYNIATSKPSNATNPNDSAYNFTKLDQWINTLKNNGFVVVLQLWGTPTWESGAPSPRSKKVSSQLADCQNPAINPYANTAYDGNKSFEPYNQAPKNNKDYADFVQAVATRYKGKVSAYSLLNEPNLKAFYTGSVDNFVDLNNQAYDRLKQVDPTIDVWSGNLSGSYSSVYVGGQPLLPETFLKLTKGNLKFDTFSVHAYPYDFTKDPTQANSIDSRAITLNNFENGFRILDSTGYKDKSIMISETGYRSAVERQYGFTQLESDFSEKLKAIYYYQSLNKFTTDLIKRPDYLARFKGISNNTFYNAWRWWSTGLVEMYDPINKKLSLSYRLPAFFVFANWDIPRITNSRLLYTTLGSASSTSTIPSSSSTIFYPSSLGITAISGETYWYKENQSKTWSSATLKSIYSKSSNYNSAGVPTSVIDTAYFNGTGGYTVIKGNKYWYRSTTTSNWYTNTLAQAYATGNWQSVGVPISNIDVAYFDSSGGYTVIKGTYYWYRANKATNWYKNTLQSAYYSSPNASSIGIPTSNIDSAYFDSDGGYTVIKGADAWYRPSPKANWVKFSKEYEILYR